MPISSNLIYLLNFDRKREKNSNRPLSRASTDYGKTSPSQLQVAEGIPSQTLHCFWDNFTHHPALLRGGRIKAGL